MYEPALFAARTTSALTEQAFTPRKGLLRRGRKNYGRLGPDYVGVT